MLSKPFVFVYNILESKFQVFGNSLLSHIPKLFTEEGCECQLLPIRNGAFSDFASRREQIVSALRLLGDCHLIGFSTAGVDCRLALNELKASSLTTISSPHNGSRLAIWAASNESILSVIEPITQYLGLPLEAFLEYSPKHLRKIDQNRATEEGVYSITAWKEYEESGMLLQESNRILQELTDYLDMNDGVFTVKDCEYAEHLMSFDADHAELVGSNLNNPIGPIFRLVIDNIAARE